MFSALKTHISKHAVAYALIPVVSIGWSIQQRDLDAYATLMKMTHRHMEIKLGGLQKCFDEHDLRFQKLHNELMEEKERNSKLEEKTRKIEATLAKQENINKNDHEALGAVVFFTWLAMGPPVLLGCVVCAGVAMGK